VTGCVALGGTAVVVYHGRTENIHTVFKLAAFEMTPILGAGSAMGSLSYMQRKMSIVRQPLYLQHQGTYKAFDPACTLSVFRFLN
jgi:hypothetical protein